MVQVVLVSDDICFKKQAFYFLNDLFLGKKILPLAFEYEEFFNSIQNSSFSQYKNYYIIESQKQVSFTMTQCMKLREIDKNGMIILLLKDIASDGIAFSYAISHFKTYVKTEKDYFEKIYNFIRENLRCTVPDLLIGLSEIKEKNPNNNIVKTKQVRNLKNDEYNVYIQPSENANPEIITEPIYFSHKSEFLWEEEVK